MNYRNTEMKVDQIVNYFNEEKINLSPAFQRGHVWSIGIRRKLIKNIVQGRPIPAIFLYKEASGSKYSYNILDGKQRLESLIMFIGNQHPDIAVKNWHKYFFAEKQKKDMGFSIELPKGKLSFHELDEGIVRDIREYAIPTVEISLTDESSLDEIINLFVDINQQGVPVNRFDIVKAMGKNDPMLRSVFELLAVEERRGQDVFYKVKNTDVTAVLKRMQIVEKLTEANSKVDRMWERLLEIVLFLKTKRHRKPAEILKSFISKPERRLGRLSKAEAKELKRPFTFLRKAYKKSGLAATRLATDQTHFYILITSLLGSTLLDDFPEGVLTNKLVSFGKILDGGDKVPKDKKLQAAIDDYLNISTKQTTDVEKRKDRQNRFIEIVKSL